MAEIISSDKKTTKKNYHKNLKVDLTPMVDLGFLLITFFILTTSMQQQTALRLILPKDSPVETKVAASSTLTFILNKNDSISYYDGFAASSKHASFSEMRTIIQQKKASLVSHKIDKNNLTIIIKPTKESTYKNFIDALDEISINDCRHYFIAEPDKSEVL